MSLLRSGRPTTIDDYQDIVNGLGGGEGVGCGEWYEDPNFRPVDESLIDPNDIIDDLMELGPVEWKRTADIPALNDSEGKRHIFAGEIEPNDIKQGQIGDCYFLSSLAALAETSSRIKQMFIIDEAASEKGLYATYMYKNGVKMVVYCDDLFPCKGDQVAFARSNGAELWVLLLEKMWAKLHGCYDRIAGGLEYETIRDLCGAPGYFFTGIDEDAFDRIYEFDQQNYMMGCSMSDQYDVGRAEEQGIVAGHAYTLLSAAKVRDRSNQEHKLVKLRNPWGSGEWNGSWSDKSSEWTSDLRRQVGFDGDKDDGIFWMGFMEFQEIFGFWSVNKYIEGAKFNHVMVQEEFYGSNDFQNRYQKNKMYRLFRVNVHETGFHTFAVSQFGNRLVPRKVQYKYANVVAYLVKEQNDNEDYKDCKFVEAQVTRQDRDTYLEVEYLEAGYYWFYIQLEWQPSSYQILEGVQADSSNLSYSVNCYGVGDVDFGESLHEQYEQFDVLSHIMFAYCEYHSNQDDDVVKLDETQYDGMKIYEESNYWETGFNFKLVHNTTSDQVMVLCHSHLDFKNGFIIPPTEDYKDTEGYKEAPYEVSRSQYVFSVPPMSKRGIFTKPYTGFGRGGQAHTPYVVDVSKFDSNIMNYYTSHYNRYQLKSHNVPQLMDDELKSDKLPQDALIEVEDEGTAPVVKSKFRVGTQARELKSYTILVIMPGEEDLKTFDEILKHKDFLAIATGDHPQSKNLQEMNLTVKTATFEDFKDGRREDEYNFVGLAYLNHFTKSDLEQQDEFIKYYTQVPIVHVFLGKVMEKDEATLSSSYNYLMDHFDKKLGVEDPTYLPKNADEAIGPFLQTVKKLAQVYQDKKNNDVKKAFDKFDKDGNGTIDIKELGELSKDLGHPLSKRQLQEAFIELDLNHDGIVDFEEFARWYFTGMKSYSGTKRSMLQMTNKTTTIVEALKKENIANILNKDKRITKHNVLVSLNNPPEGQRVQIKLHAFGPETARLEQECFTFKDLISDKFEFKDHGKTVDHYGCVKVKIKKTGLRKMKQVCRDLQAMFDDITKKEKHTFASCSVVKDQFMLQIFSRLPKRDSCLGPFPDIPDSLIESLRNVEQGVDIKLTTGFSPKEILESKKSVVELVTMKGLKAEVEIAFKRSLHKTLQEAFKDQENAFTQGLAMCGPAFGLNTRLKTELTFKDFKEIQEHPMAAQFVLTLDEILKMAVNCDMKELNKAKFDLADFEPEKIQELLKSEELSKNDIEELKVINIILTLLDECDPVTRADASAYLGGIMSVEAEIRGHGFAELIATIVRASTKRSRKRDYEYIHKKYLKAYDNAKYLELYGEEEYKDEDAKDPEYKDADYGYGGDYGMMEGEGMGDYYPMMAYEDAPMMAYEDAPMMMAYEDAPMMMAYDDAPMMEEKAPLIMEEQKAAPMAQKDSQPKKVKSHMKPSQSLQEDVYGDTEQMRQIKAYIQEQVQLRVNAAIDQEAERQIEAQMKDFKEQYLREAVQRIPQQNGSNANAAQIGRIPASVVMGRQSMKKDPQSPVGEKSERATRANRKDRAAAQVPSNTLKRAESQAKNKELRAAEQLGKKAASPNRFKK